MHHVTLLLLLLTACGRRDVPKVPPSEPATEPTPAPEPTPELLESEGLDADLAKVQTFHDTRPIFERPLGVGTKVPAGLPDLSASTCGACHTEIYAEWKTSTHAHAWTDRQYQAEISKSGNRWLCLNCHTPLLVQQDLWPIGLVDDDVEVPRLVPNPVFDLALQDEGITCAACHVRDGIIHGPGLPDSQPPHPVKADPSYRDGTLCERCHQAVATYPGKDFVCTFQTGDEWRAGPYDEEGTGCVDCHMPTVEQAVAVGAPVRTAGRHTWRGAGVPKVAGGHAASASPPPGLDLTATWNPGALTLVLTNANAGHRLPTGDPERGVEIEVQLFAKDVPVGEPFTHRMGQTWTWWPAPKKEADNRLAPRESRELQVPLTDGADRAVITATSRRISEETADYHHLDDYPRAVRTHRLEISANGSTGGLLPIAIAP